jgi:predicted nucleic acid-binding protein
MKKKVYLDTTIPSYLFEERESIKYHVEVTQAWWARERTNFDLYISDETVTELIRGDYSHQLKALKCVSELNMLSLSKRIVEITQVYVDNYLMPRMLEGDARHLAYASFYQMDFLLTWNCNHLANANKQQHIRIINARLKLSTPDIVTPLQLFTENT